MEVKLIRFLAILALMVLGAVVMSWLSDTLKVPRELVIVALIVSGYMLARAIK